MSIETFLTIFPGIIAGGITFVFATFKKENNLYKENKEKYYNEILKPFFYSYVNNKKKLDSINIFNDYFDAEEFYYIPGYIHYLKMAGKSDVLTKILLVDYMLYYPSYKNSVAKSLDAIADNSNVVLIFLNFLMIFPVLFIILISIPMIIIEYVNYINHKDYVLITIMELEVPIFIFQSIFLVILIILIIFLFRLINNGYSKYDLYTYDEIYIKKTITRLTKKYKKMENSNIFTNRKESETVYIKL